jgi:hypothetical protein
MDPAEGSSRWHRWAVKGAGSQLSQLLDVLDAHLPAGWKRVTGDALLPYESLVRPGSAWYAIDTTPSHVGATLSLERLGESELRGGKVWLAGPPYPSPAADVPSAWDQVMRFLDEGVIPAARSVGAEIQMPTPEDVFLSELPSDVRDRLLTFSKAVRKSLPLGREEADLWRGFVIAAFRAQVVIDPRPFTDWLISQGWPKESAEELVARFFDHSLLLSRYADEASAA